MRNGNAPKIDPRDKNKINDVDLTELKRWLRHGDIVDLAKRKKITRSAAYAILSGVNKNFDFLEAALQKSIDNKRKIHLLNQRLYAISVDPAA